MVCSCGLYAAWRANSTAKRLESLCATEAWLMSTLVPITTRAMTSNIASSANFIASFCQGILASWVAGCTKRLSALALLMLCTVLVIRDITMVKMCRLWPSLAMHDLLTRWIVLYEKN